ncbi:hypothetical protein [Streptomyces sp. URMC 124]|uniref:hypothetical protein n=1 Tax=Streptomyces sp. URMC 124 TaxID=3423405 RepID=UPI003F19B5A2
MTPLRTALVRTFPTLLTLPLCAALAATGLLPWNVVLTVPVALAAYAVLTFVRIKRIKRGRSH